MGFSGRKSAGPILVAVLCLVGARVEAERLPVRTYTTADGLARNRVNRIVPDSKGFIWLGTAEGLSRFDGYTFVNYGTRDGLASRMVLDVLEARDGTYWVATAEGLCRMHPKNPQRLFSLYDRPRIEFQHSINALMQDRAGVVWAATDAGLYRTGDSPNEGLQRVDIGIPVDLPYSELRTVIEDRRGSLWTAGAAGVFRRFPDGRVEVYSVFDERPGNVVEKLLEDSEGHIWAGTRSGLLRLVDDPKPGSNAVERRITAADGLASPDIKALTASPDGSVWAGCLSGGISEVRITATGRAEIRTFGKAQGLSDETITALAHDHEGNLWVGGESGGAMRIVHNGFTTYTHADGLGSDRTVEVFECRNHALCAAGNQETRGFISQFDGERFNTVFPSRPSPFNFGWAWSQVALQDHAGRWWMATPGGLTGFAGIAFPQLASAQPEHTYNATNGMPAHDVFRIFEDSGGGIWAATAGGKNAVTRWDPLSQTFQTFPRTNRLDQMASAFAGDRAGNVWFGLYNGGLVRYRKGIFKEFGAEDGVPAGLIVTLYVDEAGRLWIGSADGGLGRIDSPDADRPAIRVYDASSGLSSDTVNSITSDQWGRIYAGTGRGLDRLDPHTDRIKHYTTADGLANDTAASAVRDSRGWLWFATTKGISRLIPQPDQPRPPPPAVLITGLTIAGKPYAVSQLGETSLSGLEFANGQVQIEFAGPSFEAGESLNYQYRIEGGGGDWSPPGKLRNVNLAGLSAGSYRFLVRAVDSSGQVSAQPAAIAFRIPPAVWGRLWFQLLVCLVVGALLYYFYRVRLAQVLQLEHMRTRIATDLHDDVGSSLSQIAILSEVARRPAEPGAPGSDPLDRIASISREMLDSMADIVWAINPHRDSLLDLTRRMRQFAGEMLVARDIGCTFDAEGAMRDVHLDADLRRQLFLIFKESVSNAARHSGAAHVEIAFAARDHVLELTIADDGQGFDTALASAGHGLASMHARAAALKGTLEIRSTSGGTSVRFEVPLPPRWRLYG